MRLTFILTISTVIMAAVAIWGLTTTIMIIAPQPKEANAAPTSTLIDTTQMMKDARNLPVERFEAH